MCGLAGIIFGKKRRTKKEIQHLLDIFTCLLVLSEVRGHHATGVAWLKTDGTYDLFKAPSPASRFVQEPRYADLLAGVDNKTTILMGHTRWRTQGSERNNLNNHPLLVDRCFLTHNGHLTNVDALFRRFRFARQAEVDSEIFAHFGERACRDSGWDVARLGRYISHCRGTMAVVMASPAIPGHVVLMRDFSRPLILVYSPYHGVIVYASSPSFLLQSLSSDDEWQGLAVPPMTLLEVVNLIKYPHFRIKRHRLTSQLLEPTITLGVDPSDAV